MGFSEKELAQRLFCMFVLEINRTCNEREVESPPNCVRRCAEEAVDCVRKFEAVWLDYMSKRG